MRLRAQQHGAALLAMLAVLVLGGAWWIVSGMKQPANRVALQREQNGPVLQQAKQALIAWAAAQAASQDQNPGQLPCPELAANIGTANEGIAASSCTLPAVGRLPWRTLGMEKLRDATGEPLWYVVSSGWALPNLTTTSLGINSNSVGNLGVDGIANAAVAMIVAPGAAIVVAPNANQLAAGCAARTQSRNPAAPNYLDYLECQNVAGASLRTRVVDNAANIVSNDQAVVVAAADVMAAVEPVVALRIQRDVVPQLQAVYASTDWGTASGPIFPFAAPYADPAFSAFKGTSGTKQGLLPLTAATCNAMTAGRCDSSFVQWNAAATGVTKSAGTGTLSSFSCTGTSTLTCTVVFGCSSLCLVPTLTVNVVAYASNVGLSLRSYDNTYTVTGLSSVTKIQPYSPLQADGSAKLNFIGTLAAGPLFCFATNCATQTFTVPLTMFPDHALLNPSSTDAWYWFVANKWHYVTYYAVSPDHLPGGGYSCSSNCITVSMQGGSMLANRRAVLALGGRSLTGTAGSNRPLSDLLDLAENTDGNETFQQKLYNRSHFNDRFVSLSP